MSQQAAAVAAACCCPKEEYDYCRPPHSSVLVSMPTIEFEYGCYYHSWREAVPLSCEGSANGDECDGPQWDCTFIQNRRGSVTPTFVMSRLDTNGLYATRVDCAAGINEGYIGGSLEGERSVEYTGWRNAHDGTWLLARDAWIGNRACVPGICVPACAGVQCLGVSQDQTASRYLVHAYMMLGAGLPSEYGPCSPFAPQSYRLFVHVRCVSTQLAQDWCRCVSNFAVPPLYGDGFNPIIEYAKNCCPGTPGGGVRGTYRSLFTTTSPPAITFCSNAEDAEPIEFTPWRFPTTLTVS